MARARAVGPRNVEGEGDTLIEQYTVFFFGTDIPVVDSSTITVRIEPADSLTTARTKLIDAMMAEGRALGYAMARTRCTYPGVDKGS